VTKIYSVADLIGPVHPIAWAPPAAEGREASLMKVITHVTTPHAWSVLGGPGKIEYYPIGKAVAVTQTPDVQEQITEILAALRRWHEHQAIPAPPTYMPFMPEGVAAAPTCVPFVPRMVRIVAAPVPAPPAPASPVNPGIFRVVGHFVPPPVPSVSPIPPPPVPPCTVPEAAQPATQPWVIRAVTEEGQAQLEMQSGCGTCVTGKNLHMKVSGHGFKLCAADKQVQMCSPRFQAAADRVVHTAADDCLVLEGHVWLQCHESVQRAEVFAERVIVNLADGHLKIRADGMAAAGSARKTKPD
jgi:hypothetical protein